MPPEEQERVRSAFFQDFVAPRVSPDKIDVARSEWDELTRTSVKKHTGLIDTVIGGAKTLARNVGATIDLYQDDREELTELARRQREQPQDSRLADFLNEIGEWKKRQTGEEGWLDAAKAFAGALVKHPAGAGLMVAEQAPNAAAVLGGAAAGAAAGAKAGAVAAPFLGPAAPIAPLVGGALGGIAGMFAANASIETGAKAIESASDGKLTPERRDEIITEGLIKGGVITAVDVATLGATKIITGTVRRAAEAAAVKALTDSGVDVTSDAAVRAALANPQIVARVASAEDAAMKAAGTLSQRALRTGGALALESFGEGAGEYLGELAATGEADKMEALVEAFAGLGQSSAEIAITAAYNRSQMGRRGADRPVPEPGEPGQGGVAGLLPPPTIEAGQGFTESPEDIRAGMEIAEAAAQVYRERAQEEARVADAFRRLGMARSIDEAIASANEAAFSEAIPYSGTDAELARIEGAYTAEQESARAAELRETVPAVPFEQQPIPGAAPAPSSPQPAVQTGGIPFTRDAPPSRISPEIEQAYRAREREEAERKRIDLARLQEVAQETRVAEQDERLAREEATARAAGAGLVEEAPQTPLTAAIERAGIRPEQFPARPVTPEQRQLSTIGQHLTEQGARDLPDQKLQLVAKAGSKDIAPIAKRELTLREKLRSQKALDPRDERLAARLFSGKPLSEGARVRAIRLGLGMPQPDGSWRFTQRAYQLRKKLRDNEVLGVGDGVPRETLEGQLLRTDELPEEVRADAEKTISEDFEWNNDGGEIRWRLQQLPTAGFEDYVPDPDHQPEFERHAERLASEIKKSGRFQPVVIGPSSFEGHHRVRAAQILGMDSVPVYVFDRETDPEQIKSAVGNRGTFDPNDPNILKQETAPVDVFHIDTEVEPADEPEPSVPRRTKLPAALARRNDVYQAKPEHAAVIARAVRGTMQASALARRALPRITAFAVHSPRFVFGPEGKTISQGAYAQFFPAHAVITIREDLLDRAKTERAMQQKLIGFLVHEAHHFEDLESAQTLSAFTESHPAFEIAENEEGERTAVGELMVEALSAYENTNEINLYAFLGYPFHHWTDQLTDASFFQKELFAQLGRLYAVNPQLMQRELPKAYGLFQQIEQRPWRQVATETAQRAKDLRRLQPEVRQARAGLGVDEPLAAGSEVDRGGRDLGRQAPGGAAERRGDVALAVAEGARRAPRGPRRPDLRSEARFSRFAENLPRTEEGAFVGSRGMREPELKRIIQMLLADAKKGEHAKDWYKDTVEETVRAFQGNRQAADRFFQIIAITSANTEVKANFTLAERVLLQYVMGQPIDVSSESNNNKLNDLLYFGIPWEGRKTNNFYVKFQHYLTGAPMSESVQDIHMGRRILGVDVPSDAEYTFADAVTRFAAQELGWTIDQAQAAIWVPQKARSLFANYKEKGFHRGTSDAALKRMAMAEASINYGELIRRRGWFFPPEGLSFKGNEELRAEGRNLTAEVKPSTSLPEGRALLNASQKRLREFQEAALSAVFGSRGPAALFEAFGLNRARYRVVEGAGGYDASTAPNVVATAKVDRDQAMLLAKAWMYIFRQDAVPFFRADPALSGDRNAARGVHITFERALNQTQERAFYDALRGQVNAGLGYTRTGPGEYVVINFRGEDDTPLAMDDEAFTNGLRRLVDSGALPAKVSDYGFFGSETAYPFHDWKQDPEGRSLRGEIAASGPSAFQSRVRDWAERFRRHTRPLAQAQRLAERRDARAREEVAPLASRAPPSAANDAVDFLVRLSQDDETFRLPRSEHKDFKSVLAEVFPDAKVSRAPVSAQMRSSGIETDWYITVPGGFNAHVFEGTALDIHEGAAVERARRDEVWVDVSSFRSGRAGGFRLYQAAMDYAHNTGKVFVGDPGGLSDTALLRRTEMMLSSALKWGTTRHLAPHDKQTRPGEYADSRIGEGTRALDWREGASRDAWLHNLRELLLTSYRNVMRFAPELKGVVYNPTSSQFETLDGEVVNDEAFERYQRQAATRYREATASGGADPGTGGRSRADAEASPFGSGSLKKAAFLNTVLRQESGEVRRGLLDALGRELSARVSGVPDPLRGLLASRRPEAPPKAGLSVSRVRRVLVAAFGARGVASLERQGILKIVPRYADLPPGATAGMTSGEEAIYWRGTAYLIAENLTEGRIAPVLLHEVGEHYGLERMLGRDAYLSVLDRVREMHAAGEAQVSEAWSGVLEDPGYRQLGEGSELFTKEVLARLGESAAFRRLPLWQRIVHLVRQFLRSIGFDRPFTADELTELVNASLKRAMRQNVGSPAQVPTFAAASEKTPVFYSELARQIERGPNRASAEQWRAYINNLKQKGVKAEEIEFSGILDIIEMTEDGGPIGKDVLTSWLADKGVRVGETQLSDDFKVSPELQRLMDRDRFHPNNAEEWTALADSLERQGQRWQANGDTAKANRFFGYSQEAREFADALETPSGRALGATKFSAYQLPGGKNYRELLLTLPTKPGHVEFSDVDVKRWHDISDRVWDSASDRERATMREEFIAVNPGRIVEATQDFRSAHFDQPNILAHVRFNERTDAEGKRVLFIEEIQSDWAQKGKREGFRDKARIEHVPNYDWDETARRDLDIQGDVEGRAPAWVVYNAQGKQVGAFTAEKYAQEALGAVRRASHIPSAPFVGKTESWVALALKRMIRYAADNGFERIAWTTGEQQAERYDLSKHLKTVLISRNNDGELNVFGYSSEGRALTSDRVIEQRGIADGKLSDYVGKELADRFLKSGKSSAKYSGLDLKVGGEGMKAFYDRIVPNVANDVLKKLGGGRVTVAHATPADIGARTWNADGEETTPRPRNSGFDITPELRARALQGLPLFARHAGYAKAFSNLIARVRQGGPEARRAGGHAVPVMETPRALAGATNKGTRVLANSHVITYFGRLRETANEHGAVPDAVLERLPELLENPRSIFAPRAKSKTVQVVLREQVRGKHVVVAIDPTRTFGGAGVNEIVRVELRPEEHVRGWQREGLQMKSPGQLPGTIPGGPGQAAEAAQPETVPEREGSVNGPASSEDAAARLEYLRNRARELGFEDLDEFLKTNPQEFDQMAREWRERPMASRRSMPKWAQSQPQGVQEALRKAGVIVEEKTLRERLADLKSGFWQELRQGIFDQYDPIKQLDYRAYMMARMAKSADQGIEALMMYGRPFLREGALDVRYGEGGLIKTLQRLQGEHDRFFAWVAGNRAARLKSEGRENLFTDEDISALKALDQGRMPGGASRRELYASVLQQFNAYSKAVLDIAEQTGLINKEDRKTWEHDFYVPFYRVMEEGVAGPNLSRGLVNQYAFKRLKGGREDLNDLMANTLRNWSHLLSASLKNQAARASLEAAVDAGVAIEVPTQQMGKEMRLGTDIVKVLDEGVERYFMVENPLVLDAITSLEWAGFQGHAMKALSKFKHWLTFGVTVNPTFRIRNLMRDAITAMAQSDLSYNPFKNIAQGWQATAHESASRASKLASGAIFRFGTMLEGNRADHVRRLIDKGVDAATIVDGENKLKAVLQQWWDAYQENGDRFENANRAALYEQLRAQGYDHLEAAYAARDLLDFSMQGKWRAIRFLVQTVPFFNARLQGLYKLGRSAKENPKKLAYVMGGVVMASLALMLYYQDDDDWKNREEWDRDNFWWFKVGDTAFRIPKPFEVGAVGSLAERAAEWMISNEKGAGRRFARRLGALVADNLSMNPTPQLVKPLIDLYANKDSFTGRPIETTGMERLSKGERAGPHTTVPAQLLGKLGLLSPVQVDFAMRAYFGWVGTAALTALDYGLRPTLGYSSRPSMRMRDVFLAGNFVEGLPAGQSRYVTAFYEQAKEIEEAYADYRNALKLGDSEKAARIVREKQTEIAQYRGLSSIKRRISEINTQEKRVEASRTMSPETKRRLLDMFASQKRKLAELGVR